MSRLLRSIVLGTLIGIVGITLSLSPLGLDLEENLGLDLLFHLRGTVRPPPDVVIVSIDRKSAETLQVSKDSRKWPRSLHAQLTDRLLKEGAVAVAFDLSFDEAKSAEEDDLLAAAIYKAHNVVLCESLHREKVPLDDGKGFPAGNLAIERVVPPIPSLAKAAVAMAPFPLPRVPVRVSQFWTFKTEAGDTPTLPVVMFQLFAADVYEEFIHLLEKVSPGRAAGLPHGWEMVITARSLENVIHDIRSIFEDEPLVGERMLEELQTWRTLSGDSRRIKMLTSLIKMYQRANSSYLDFCGPPGTVTTVPYYQALHPGKETGPGSERSLFEGRAVFVGISERSLSEQKDGFYTVFSEPSGLDLSGVEIAATAFANLLEDRPVQILPFWRHLALILLWGVAIGMVSHLLPTLAAAVGVIGLSALYLAAAAHQFKAFAGWYPVILPLTIQSPLAFFAAIVWKSIEANKERQNIRKALQNYLPDRVIDQLARKVGDPKTGRQLVYGICLYTDAEQYTALSETMDPEELGSFMNRYFEFLFKPIKEHGGIVSNIVGDSMLALWVTEKPDASLRIQACQAALDVARAVDQFNRTSPKPKLPTRIGLHSGYLLLGNVGALDHYEYHPIGDIVNTATRIEGLNKYLGTRVLATEEVIHQLDRFFTRELGQFLMVGKTRPLSIHELVCPMEESSETQRRQGEMFGRVLDAFRNRSWDEAIERAEASIGLFGKDGPSLFYQKLCEQYKKAPPDESWDGVVRTLGK